MQFRRIVAQIVYDLKLRRPASHILHRHCTADRAVLDYAQRRHVPLFSPQNQKDPAFYEAIQALQADLILSFGYPKLVPKRILEAAHFGGINIHPGRLPQRGGGTPNRWAVYYGDKTAGLYAHAMTSKFDAGSVLHSLDIDIQDNLDAQTTEEALLANIPHFLDGLFAAINNACAQNAHERFDSISQSAPDILPPFRGPHQRIDWEQDTSQTIIQKCRAMRPKSGAITHYQGQVLCFYGVECVSEAQPSSAKPGCFLGFDQDGWPLFKTRDGAIAVQKILYGSQVRSGKLLGWYYGIGSSTQLG